MAPMSLEEFAGIHRLPSTWIELRSQCTRIVEQPDFWYRKDIQDRARELSVKASDMLMAAIKGEGQK